MSATILPEMPSVRPSRRLSIEARLAVLAAHGLTRLPPGSLEKILRVVISRGDRPKLHEVEQFRDAVTSVSTVCAGHGCLPRSVATTIVARMNGFAVSWVTGIRDAPFAAHAWVEVAGRPVSEPSEVSVFTRVLSAVPVYRRSSPTSGSEVLRNG